MFASIDVDFLEIENGLFHLHGHGFAQAERRRTTDHVPEWRPAVSGLQGETVFTPKTRARFLVDTSRSPCISTTSAMGVWLDIILGSTIPMRLTVKDTWRYEME